MKRPAAAMRPMISRVARRVPAAILSQLTGCIGELPGADRPIARTWIVVVAMR